MPLRADRANAGHLAARGAWRRGAALRRRAVDWRPAAGGGFEVETADGTVLGADHLVLTTGPGSPSSCPTSRLPLEVEREVPVFWFEPDGRPHRRSAADRLPIWVLDASPTRCTTASRTTPRSGSRSRSITRGTSSSPTRSIAPSTRKPTSNGSASSSVADMPAADGPLVHADGLPLHERRRIADVRHRRSPGGPGRRLRVRLLGSRLQVRAGDRRDPGGPRDDRRRPADRAFELNASPVKRRRKLARHDPPPGDCRSTGRFEGLRRRRWLDISWWIACGISQQSISLRARPWLASRTQPRWTIAALDARWDRRLVARSDLADARRGPRATCGEVFADCSSWSGMWLSR